MTIRSHAARAVGRWPLTLLATLLIAYPRLADAQAELQGRVLDETARRPIANAQVAIPALSIGAVSDSLGRYRLARIPRGEHLVVTRAVGYRPDSSRSVFDGDETLVSDVVLRVALHELPTVAVRDTSRPLSRGKMAAYEERKAIGIGRFLDRDLLAKDENRRLSEIINANVPGVHVHRGSGSKAWVASGRNASSAKCAFCPASKREMLDPVDIAAGAPLACYMDVYLDGTLAYNSTARTTPLFNLNSIGPSEIEAIEVYTSAAQIPPQYNKTSGGCGVMLIWTRVGNR